jgi:hypothetical protein
MGRKNIAKSAKVIALFTGIGAAVGAVLPLFRNSWRTFVWGEDLPIEAWFGSVVIEGAEFAVWGFLFAVILVCFGKDNSPQNPTTDAPIAKKLTLGRWLVHGAAILITLPLTMLFLWAFFTGEFPRGSSLYTNLVVLAVMVGTTFVFVRSFLHELSEDRGRTTVQTDHDAH